MVKPNSYGMVTDPTLIFKTVSVSGHKYTYSSVPQVTYAVLSVVGSPTYSISGKVSDSGGNPIVGATVYFKASANASVSPVATTTTDSSGNYNMPIINGTWYVAAGSSLYYVSADQTVTVNSANVTNVNFTLSARPRIIGTVIDQSTGLPVAGATVAFKTSANAMVSPAYTTTTDSNGTYIQGLTVGTWYVAAGAKNYDNTVDQTAITSDGVINTVNFLLVSPPPMNVPQSGSLIFAALAAALPATGSITSWDTYTPVGTMSATGTFNVDPVGVKKWAQSAYNSSTATGFLQGTYSSAIPVTGATIVMYVKPTRNSTSTTTTSCVEIFGTELSLGVRNSTGRVNCYINGTRSYASANAITSGAAAVVSLVVQSTGAFVAYVNGTSVLTGTASALTSLDITNGASIWVAGGANAGSSFNGDIGDVFVYNTALSTSDRAALETDITNRCRITSARNTLSLLRQARMEPSLQAGQCRSTPETTRRLPSRAIQATAWRMFLWTESAWERYTAIHLAT